MLYADCLFFKVNRIPFQSDYFAPPQAVKRGKNNAQLNGVSLYSLEKSFQLLLIVNRRKVLPLPVS